MKDIENRIQQLFIVLIKEKDKKKRLEALEEVLVLNKLYTTVTKKSFDDGIEEYSVEEDFKMLDKKEYSHFKVFTSNYNNEFDYHEKFSKNAILTLCDNFELGQIMDYSSKIPEITMKEIILSFFEKYLNEYYQLVKSYYEKNNFYFLHDWSNKASASTFYLPFSKESLIVCDDKMSLQTMVNIVHELGHMICYYELKNDVSSMEKSYFFEVFSCSLERIFIKYLIDENFLVSECIHYLNEEDNTFFESADHLCFLTKLRDLKLDIGYNVKNCNDFFVKYPSIDVDKEMYKDLNLKDDLSYFYGYLLSLEYEEQFFKDQEKTLKYLKNLNLKNGVYPMKKLFSTSNLLIDDISNMKTLKKRLDYR